MKEFNIMYGIGKTKYIVNYHDAIKVHKDNSKFFDIAIFKNKRDLNSFTNKLLAEGYIKTN